MISARDGPPSGPCAGRGAMKMYTTVMAALRLGLFEHTGAVRSANQLFAAPQICRANQWLPCGVFNEHRQRENRSSRWLLCSNVRRQ